MEFDYPLYAKMIKEFVPFGASMLDLACGTGTMITYLSDAYNITGADYSEEMLDVARSKTPHIPYFIYDLREPLYVEHVDSVICTVDSFNYVIDFETLKRIFHDIEVILESGKTFVFDVYAESKLQTMDGYHYRGEDDGFIFEWNSTVDDTLITHDIYISDDGEEVKETHFERVYSEEDIESLLTSFTFEKEYMTDRILYFCKKK